MIKSELIKLNYRNGVNNYILLSNSENRWVAFSKKVIDKLIQKYDEKFNIIIYWDIDKYEVEYYTIPYKEIKHLLTEEHLSHQKDGSLRWTFTITNNLLCVHANTTYSIDVEKYLNNVIENQDNNTNSLHGVEGDQKIKVHITKERDTNLIKEFKRYKSEKDPLLCCEICELSFELKYGEIGKGFIEAHHIKPIYTLEEESITTFDDLILVCSNCHSMLHRRIPPISAHELRIMLNK